MVLDRTLFLDSPERILKWHGEKLRSLVGSRLQEGWIAWDTEEDEWWADEAVILKFGEVQIEIVCFQLKEMALTWGQIDVNSKPCHVADWGDALLQWKEDAHAVLAKARGGLLEEVSILEYRFRTQSAGSTKWNEAWLLHGIEFKLTSGMICLFNALDEIGIEDQEFTGPDFRRTSL